MNKRKNISLKLAQPLPVKLELDYDQLADAFLRAQKKAKQVKKTENLGAMKKCGSAVFWILSIFSGLLLLSIWLPNSQVPWSFPYVISRIITSLPFLLMIGLSIAYEKMAKKDLSPLLLQFFGISMSVLALIGTMMSFVSGR